MKIAFNDLGAQYRRHQADIDDAVARVMASGHYIGGPEVEAFEQAFARYAQATHAVGVANGTDALALLLMSEGIGHGDEVIIPALSAYPTAVAVLRAGATPVFVDVDDACLIDPVSAEQAIGPRTKALLPVHLFGHVCDGGALEELAMRRGLALIEDCAQAHGASRRGKAVGSWGVGAAWSFYPTKNLGAVGDAGAVTTQDAQRSERLRRLRNYGQSNRYEHVEPGINARLDPIQAAILGVKMRWLPAETERRRSIAQRYDQAFASLRQLQPIRPAAEVIPSRHLYVLCVAAAKDRDELQRSLNTAGVETLVHYPIAMPDQEASRHVGRVSHDVSRTRNLCQRVLSIPVHPELSDSQVDVVIEAVCAWDAGR